MRSPATTGMVCRPVWLRRAARLTTLFDVSRSDAPGDLDYQIDFARAITPLTPDHHIGPCNLVHTVFREHPPGHGLLQEGHQFIFREDMGATHQAGQIRKGMGAVALFEGHAFQPPHIILQPHDLPLSTPLCFY